jgi:hypothetical protein
MRGKREGPGDGNNVAALLAKWQPFLVPIHCIAHRHALAVKDAGATVNYMDKKFKTALSSFFFHVRASSVRVAHLRAVQVKTRTYAE